MPELNSEHSWEVMTRRSRRRAFPRFDDRRSSDFVVVQKPVRALPILRVHSEEMIEVVNDAFGEEGYKDLRHNRRRVILFEGDEDSLPSLAIKGEPLIRHIGEVLGAHVNLLDDHRQEELTREVHRFKRLQRCRSAGAFAVAAEAAQELMETNESLEQIQQEQVRAITIVDNIGQAFPAPPTQL